MEVNELTMRLRKFVIHVDIHRREKLHGYVFDGRTTFLVAKLVHLEDRSCLPIRPVNVVLRQANNSNIARKIYPS